MIYSNSKTNVEGSLLTSATKICKKLYNSAKVHPDAIKTFADSLTGGDGLKRKCCTMQAVTNYSKDYDSTNEIILDKIQIVVGTEAMNAGMSSDYMKYCMYRGIPPNMYVLLQCMGRVDC